MSGCYQVCQAGHCEMRFVFLCHSLPWLLPLLRFRVFFVCRLPSSPAPRVPFSCSRAQPSRQGPSSAARSPRARLPPLPLAERSLLSPRSRIAEARCAFKESRLLAVTHFWLSARKIAPARPTEKKTNNFSFVCGVTFH